MQWTEEQINQLAPNDSTERRARQLATSSKWNGLSTNHKGVWGSCTGSGSQSYQVQLELSSPRFKCSCPVRKLPCKHSLALLYLYTKSSGLFKYQAPPPAIEQWLERQSGGVSTSKNSSSPQAEKTDEELAKAELAKERRWQQRLLLMQGGMDELEQWLKDLVRQGIANTDALHRSYWDQVAAKMVDAKLPSVGAYLKETHRVLQAHTDWSEPVVRRIGVLYGWIRAFKQQERLPESLQQELYTRLGKTTQKNKVVEKGNTTTDRWMVAAAWEDEDVEGRAFRKVWLWGAKSHRWALLLDFSFGAVAYEQSYPLGSIWQGTLAFYSDTYPQRATWVTFQPDRSLLPLSPIACYPLEQHLEQYSQILQKNPWLSSIAVALNGLRAHLDKKRRLVLADGRQQIPVAPLSETSQWILLSISGGHPIDLIGEWNGLYFLPLSWLDEQGVPQTLL